MQYAEVHMCLTTSGPFGAGTAGDQGLRGLQTMTAMLWTTVARVADGQVPDKQDAAVLRQVETVLRGQANALRYVQSDSGAAAPEHVAVGLDTLVDLIWRAANQLANEPDMVQDPVAGLDTLAAALHKIYSEKDRTTAKRYDQLLERVSLLAEQMTGDPRERISP